MIRHIVLLRWAADASDDDKTATLDALRGLAATVPNVHGLLVGTDTAERGTYDFALTCDFASAEDLSAYIVHPDHQAVMAKFIKSFAQPGPEVLDFEFDNA